jgi:hypothetical protein
MKVNKYTHFNFKEALFVAPPSKWSWEFSITIWGKKCKEKSNHKPAHQMIGCVIDSYSQSFKIRKMWYLSWLSTLTRTSTLVALF